jgi:hypothetical protein
MYKIIKDGVLVGLTGTPNYIKLQENGCYGLYPEDEAQGVAFDGTPYQLEGKAKMEGLEVVTMEEAADAAVSECYIQRGVKGEQLLRACYEAGSLTSTEMVDNMVLLPDYAPAGPAGDYQHPLGECCTYDGQPWRCCQAYNAKNNPDIVPGSAAAHWVQFHTTDPTKALPFVPPTGAHNVYMDGECMLYIDGQVYRSTMDNNAYSPDEYAKGWEVVHVDQ